MTRISTGTFRTATGAGVRIFEIAASQPSWVTRAAIASAGAVMAAIALLLLIPAVVIGVAVFFLAAGVAGVRRWLARQRQPNGMLDGRRNVRVIVRPPE
jgi:hypothetical protein